VILVWRRYGLGRVEAQMAMRTLQALYRRAEVKDCQQLETIMPNAHFQEEGSNARATDTTWPPKCCKDNMGRQLMYSGEYPFGHGSCRFGTIFLFQLWDDDHGNSVKHSCPCSVSIYLVRFLYQHRSEPSFLPARFSRFNATALFRHSFKLSGISDCFFCFV
jgi:hypothetical protein